MQNPLSIFLMSCVVLFSAANSTRSVRGDEVERVVKEYRQALTVLEEALSGFQAEGRLTTATRKGDREIDEPGGARVLKYAIHGRAARLVNIAVGPPDLDNPGYSETVYVDDANRSFILGRSRAEGSYAVKSLSRFNLSNKIIFRSRSHGIFHAPCAVENDLNSTTLDFPRFSATKVEPVSRAGLALMRLHYEIRPLGSDSGYEGWYLLEPARGWIMHEYQKQHRDKWGTISSGRVEYESGDLGRPPLPRKVFQIHGEPNQNDINRFEFTKVTPAALPESEFTLSAFGLGDLEQPIRSGGSSAPWWFALAAVCAIGVVVLRRWRTRSALAQVR